MNPTREQIKPETLAIIKKQAESFGLSIDDYLRMILPLTENVLALKADASDEEFEKDMLAFAEENEIVSDYSGTYSREDIYFDHD